MSEPPVVKTPISAEDRGLLFIPCYNESLSLGNLIAEVRESGVQLDLLVINDGSSDRTAEVARAAGAVVLDLPCNLGVGRAIQAGFQYAVANGYAYVVRIDGDGQHPPGEICKLQEKAKSSPADLIIGSRFGAPEEMVSTRLRYLGVRLLAIFISTICRNRVSDPTSGFWLVRRPLLDYFAVEFPTDYPEPEALALLSRQGYGYDEVAVQFRVRQAGLSSIRSWGTVYYAFKVGIALLVDRFRPVNVQYERSRLK